MDLAIQIKLTEKQYHLLKEMARSQYRTIGNTATMLMAEGFNWYLEDHEVYVNRMERDKDSEKGHHQYYTDPEMKEIFNSMPLNQ